MKQSSTFTDVNRDAYLRALILDLTKQAGLAELPERAKVIYNYIMTNPTNADPDIKIDKNGMRIKDGCFVIGPRKRPNKK